MSSKNYMNRTSCSSNIDCLENEYCDQFGYCWWCNEYDDYCDSINEQCPTYCSSYGMNGECPECQSAASGDVNQDGIVNILDVVLMVGAIMGDNTLDATQFQAADINGDGVVNVTDVVVIVNLLLSRGEISREQATAIKNRLKHDVRTPKIRNNNQQDGDLMGMWDKKRRHKKRKRKYRARRGY